MERVEFRSVGRGEGADEVERLLEGNRGWAEDRNRADPGVFARLAEGQRPPFLFVGCCDSRMPVDVLTRTLPGELFIHRNIANLLPPEDAAAQAALEFAIGVLEVRHILVCGHTHCGGVAAALAGLDRGAVGSWLTPVRALASRVQDDLEAFPAGKARQDELARLNVIAQIEYALHSGPVRARFAGDGPPLHLHGWLYRVETGLLEVVSLPVDRWRAEGLLPG